jgi:hypothetical protein
MSILTANWEQRTDAAIQSLSSAGSAEIDGLWSELLADRETIEALAYLRESEPEIFESKITTLAAVVGKSRARTLRGVLTRRWRLFQEAATDATDRETLGDAV